MKWLKNFSSVLSAHTIEWGVPEQESSDLAAETAAYEKVYAAAKGENGTKALILEKNEKRDALKANVRSIKNRYVDYNVAVTGPNRERLGLPSRDKKHTPRPAPTSRPLLEVAPTNNRQHTVTAINQATGKKTKPADAYGVRYMWEIRDTPPTNAEDLRYQVFRRKVSEVFNYNEEARGKQVFYVARYENAKGEAGPCSDIVKAIIP